MDKLILSEKQILTTIRLSGVQKAILAKIIAAPTPEVAYEQISDGRNFVAGRDVLAKLGLIEFEEGTATVTETGKDVMKDENLMDDGEQLTADGQQYVEADDPNDINPKKVGTADADASTMPPEDDLGLGDEGGEDDLGLGGDEEKPDEEDDLSKAFEGIMQTVNTAARLINEAAIRDFSDDELNAMKAGGDLPDALMDKIYEFVVDYDPTWMPYGTQKARDGDPHEWIYDRLPEIVRAINKSAVK